MILEGHFSANLLGCLSLAENRVVRLTDRHKMTYSKNTKIHILIIHTKQEKYQSGVRFFFPNNYEYFAGPDPQIARMGPLCTVKYLIFTMISTYSSPYFFFIYACAYLQFCRHAHAYVFLFCFVIPSSILPIPCYFLSAATCINLPSNYCHYFYYFFPHTRMCASALMQTRTCVSVFFLPSTYSTYIGLCCFYFPAGSRFTHTHLRICIRAATHMRMFPYIFPIIRERGLPHVDPVVFFVLCTHFLPCCLGRTC